MNVLLLLDMNNLWNACCDQYGKRARVNLVKVVEKSKSRKTDTVSVMAFVASIPDKNQENLIRKLEEMNFKVFAVPPKDNNQIDFCDTMHVSLDECMDGYETIVLASGDPQLISIVERVNQANKNSKIIAFCNGINSSIAMEADDIRLLDKGDIIIQ